MAKNNYALVTGAAAGLGFEFSKMLANDGYNLLMVDLNKSNLNDAKAKLITNHDVHIVAIAQDLSKQESAALVYNEVQDYTIDVLINNAGFGMYGAFYENDWERELSMLNLHMITTTHLTKLVLKNMVANKNGKVLNVSSLAAFQPGPFMALYYATKAYILSFSEAIANELKGTGVSVTAFCPGPTKTLFQQTVKEGQAAGKISFNMACPEKVTQYGYKAMQRGKTYAIPGRFNKFLAFLPRLLSRNTSTRIVGRIQKKNRN